MVYRGKKRAKDDDEDEFIDDGSDSGSGGAARKKSTKKAPNKVEEDGVVVCELSKNRKVKVRTFKSMVLIDIREYYENKGGDSTPSKKGISLTLDQWNALRDHCAEIDTAIAGLKQ